MNDTDLAALVARYGPTRTLTQLLDRAEITHYTRGTWFRDAVLKPPYLFVNEDADTVAYMTKRWGADFAQQIPGLEIRSKLKTEQPKPATRYPALKPGRVRDLLDDEDA